MRKLNLSDVFAFSRLIRTLGVKNDLKALLEGGKGNGADVEQIGIDTILMVLNAAANDGVDTAAYAFLGPIFGMDPQQVAELPLDELIEKFKQLAAENDLTRFFTQAAKLTTSHSLT